MTRRVFPDQRLILRTSGVAGVAPTQAVGDVYTVYVNDTATTLADIQTYPAGDPIPGSTVTVDAQSNLPFFLGPANGASVLWIRRGSGPILPIDARAIDRVPQAQTLPSSADPLVVLQVNSANALGPLLVSGGEHPFGGDMLNPMLYVGYNVRSNGTRVVLAEPGVCTGHEGNYHHVDENGNTTGQYMEWYAQFLAAGDGTGPVVPVRPFGAQFDRATGQLASVEIRCNDNGLLNVQNQSGTWNHFQCGSAAAVGGEGGTAASFLRLGYHDLPQAFTVQTVTAWETQVHVNGRPVAYLAAPVVGSVPRASLAVGARDFDAAATFAVGASDATTKGVVVRGGAGQVGNLLEIQDAATNLLLTVTENGYLTLRKTTPPADAELDPGEIALWFDATAGKLMLKGKLTNGTVKTGAVTLT